MARPSKSNKFLLPRLEFQQSEQPPAVRLFAFENSTKSLRRDQPRDPQYL